MWVSLVWAVTVLIISHTVVTNCITLPTIEAHTIHSWFHDTRNVFLPIWISRIIVNLSWVITDSVSHRLTLLTKAIVEVISQSSKWKGWILWIWICWNHVIKHGYSTWLMNLVNQFFNSLSVNLSVTPGIPFLNKAINTLWERICSFTISIIEEIWVDIHRLHELKLFTVNFKIFNKNTILISWRTCYDTVTREDCPIIFNRQASTFAWQDIAWFIVDTDCHQVTRIVCQPLWRYCQVWNLSWSSCR